LLTLGILSAATASAAYWYESPYDHRYYQTQADAERAEKAARQAEEAADRAENADDQDEDDDFEPQN
jgi:hypothetical protein